MLLKWPTSEYQLEYQNLPVAIRKQIWEENIKFREFLADNNRLQHFWFYQSLEGVSKQRELTASASQVATQRLENEAVNRKETLDLSKERQLLSLSEGNLSVLSDEPIKLKSALKCKDSGTCAQIQFPESDTGHKDVAIQTPQWGEIHTLHTKKSSENKKPVIEPCFSINYCKSPQVKPNGNKQPTHKSILVQTKKTPFLSYGWNDGKKDVGSKRTFNIHASVDEIYPASLHALSRRRAMSKRGEGSRPNTAPLMSPVNHSSIWMTEYQDIFSRKRPQSAPFESKSVGSQ